MEQVVIRVKGRIDQDWSDWLGELTLTPTENNETVLAGPLRDQAALQGVLERLAGLGLDLVSLKVKGDRGSESFPLRSGERRPG